MNNGRNGSQAAASLRQNLHPKKPNPTPKKDSQEEKTESESQEEKTSTTQETPSKEEGMVEIEETTEEELEEKTEVVPESELSGGEGETVSEETGELGDDYGDDDDSYDDSDSDYGDDDRYGGSDDDYDDNYDDDDYGYSDDEDYDDQDGSTNDQEELGEEGEPNNQEPNPDGQEPNSEGQGETPDESTSSEDNPNVPPPPLDGEEGKDSGEAPTEGETPSSGEGEGQGDNNPQGEGGESQGDQSSPDQPNPNNGGQEELNKNDHPDTPNNPNAPNQSEQGSGTPNPNGIPQGGATPANGQMPQTGNPQGNNQHGQQNAGNGAQNDAPNQPGSQSGGGREPSANPHSNNSNTANDQDRLRNSLDNNKNNTPNGKDQKNKEEKDDDKDDKDKDKKDKGKNKQDGMGEDVDKNQSFLSKLTGKSDAELAIIKRRIIIRVALIGILLLGILILVLIVMALFTPLSGFEIPEVDKRYDIERNVKILIDGKRYDMGDFLICTATHYYPGYDEADNIESMSAEEAEANSREVKKNFDVLTSYYIYARALLIKYGEYVYNSEESNDYKVEIDSSKLSSGFPESGGFDFSKCAHEQTDNYEDYYFDRKKSTYVLAYFATKNKVLVPSTFNADKYILTNYQTYANIGEHDDLITDGLAYRETWINYRNNHETAEYDTILRQTHHPSDQFYYYVYDFNNISDKEPQPSQLGETKIAAYYPIGSSTCTAGLCSGDPAPSTITKKYGYEADGVTHNDGIEITATDSALNIIAMKSGVVTKTSYSPPAAAIQIADFPPEMRRMFQLDKIKNYVVITHAGGITGYYANLDLIDPSITANAHVTTGQKLGVVNKGNTFYFAIKLENGNLVNPLEYVSLENPRPSIAEFITYMEGSNNQQTICLSLKASGFDDAANAAILANVKRESSFNPTVCGDNNTSYGICQWHKGRFNNLISFSGEKGDYLSYNNSYCNSSAYKFSQMSVQLDFLIKELKESKKHVYNVLLSSESARYKGYYWCYYFEVPASRDQTCDSVRGVSAQDVYLPYVKNGCK